MFQRSHIMILVWKVERWFSDARNTVPTKAVRWKQGCFLLIHPEIMFFKFPSYNHVNQTSSGENSFEYQGTVGVEGHNGHIQSHRFWKERAHLEALQHRTHETVRSPSLRLQQGQSALSCLKVGLKRMMRISKSTEQASRHDIEMRACPWSKWEFAYLYSWAFDGFYTSLYIMQLQLFWLRCNCNCCRSCSCNAFFSGPLSFHSGTCAHTSSVVAGSGADCNSSAWSPVGIRNGFLSLEDLRRQKCTSTDGKFVVWVYWVTN